MMCTDESQQHEPACLVLPNPVAVADDPSSRRSFRRSLVASFCLHVAVLLLLAVVRHSVGHGLAGPLGIQVGTSETFPEPEVLLITDPSRLPDPGEDPVDQDDVFAAVDEALPSVLIAFNPLPVTEVHPEAIPAEEEQPSIDAPKSVAGTSFFGTTAYGDQFVYVVDTSPSMNVGQGRGPGDVSRLIRALAELRASVQHLSPEQSFYVILFNGQVRRLFDDRSPHPRALPATPENKRRLDEWLRTVRTGASTDPLPALRLGLDMQPSALFLLSDGVFDVDVSSVLQFVRGHNAAGTPIHTIAYEDERSSPTMRRIAFATGGEFRFVPPPGREPQP